MKETLQETPIHPLYTQKCQKTTQNKLTWTVVVRWGNVHQPLTESPLSSSSDQKILTLTFLYLCLSIRGSCKGVRMAGLLCDGAQGPKRGTDEGHLQDTICVSRHNHEGDCFICCILSHGSAEGVYGTDEVIVQGSDIYNPFNGVFCPSLVNKPKVFFIQACHGEVYHQFVKVQSDSQMEENAGEEKEEEELAADAVQITIPAEADFLVARSTVKDYLSFREHSGSWFIQCLC